MSGIWLHAKAFIRVIMVFVLLVPPFTVQAEPIPPRGPVPFHLYDVDNNGCISPDELARVQEMRRAARQNSGPGTGPCTGPCPGQQQGMGRGRQQNMPSFEYFDKNNDGFISEAELIEGRSMRISQRIQQGYRMKNTQNISQFQEIDSDMDGRISREEFSRHQMLHQQQRQRQFQ